MTNSLKTFINIAHRGASTYAPENTFAAYDKALSMGISHIELDVHFTSDDHIVVIHDDDVDRTTDGAGPVSSKTLAEIQSLDAGSWFGAEYAGEGVKTLAEVLQHYKGRFHFHIEIKAKNAKPTLAQRTIDMVRAHGLNDSVTITSFHKHWLQEAADYDDVLPKGWLVPLGQASQWDDSIIDESKKMDISQICPRADITTPELVSKIRDAGFVVRCHGLINEELMRHAVDVGAAGGTVNFPDKLSEYLKASGIEQVK